MPNLALGQARRSFVAGKIAVLADSASYVAAAQRQIGERFTFKTVPLHAANTRFSCIAEIDRPIQFHAGLAAAMFGRSRAAARAPLQKSG